MTSGLLVAAALLLDPDSALTFEARIPEGENVVVSLGRGREKLVVSSKDNAYPWSYTGVDGAKPTERAYPGGSRPLETSPYWWEKTDYTPNGRYNRTFALPPSVEAASEAMESARWQSAADRKLCFRVELADAGRVR